MTHIKLELPADAHQLVADVGQALVNYGENKNGKSKTHAVTQEPEIAGGVNEQQTETPSSVPEILEDRQVAAEREAEKTEALREGNADPAQDTASASTRVDGRGVEYNANYCSSNGKLYATGREKGQWQRKRGVDQAAYNAWYSAELAKLVPVEQEETETTPAQAAQGLAEMYSATEHLARPAPEAPTTPGDLAKFISTEKANKKGQEVEAVLLHIAPIYGFDSANWLTWAINNLHTNPEAVRKFIAQFWSEYHAN